MQAVWEGVVDCINGGIVKEGLVGGVDVGDVVFLGVGSGSILITGGDGDDDDAWVGFCSVDDGDGSEVNGQSYIIMCLQCIAWYAILAAPKSRCEGHLTPLAVVRGNLSSSYGKTIAEEISS